jgi:prevent-host-death family protein
MSREIRESYEARCKFGKLLRRVNRGQVSVMQKRRRPRAVLVSIKDYMRLTAPEPEVLRDIGEESIKKATHTLSSKGIEEIIKAARRKKTKR